MCSEVSSSHLWPARITEGGVEAFIAGNDVRIGEAYGPIIEACRLSAHT